MKYLEAVLLVAAVITVASWTLRRLRGGHRPDTTITFGRAEAEPVLDDADLIPPHQGRQGDNARAVVPELVDVLAIMQTNLEGLDAIDYRSLTQQGDAVPSSVRQLATETFGRIRHLDQATVPFLPDDLSKAWYSLLQLLEDLRRHGHGSSEPWSEAVLDRNRRDITQYLVTVRAALIEFATSGAVAEHRDPPNLRG